MSKQMKGDEIINKEKVRVVVMPILSTPADSNDKFVSAIASAVLAYKKYPSASGSENVGRAVVSKYPFL